MEDSVIEAWFAQVAGIAPFSNDGRSGKGGSVLRAKLVVDERWRFGLRLDCHG